MTPAEKLKFGKEKVCHICERSLDVLPPMLVKQILTAKNAIQYYKSLDNDVLVNEYMEKLEKAKKDLKINKRRVADHDHLTGELQGAAHRYCNLNYKNPRFIPIFFHNLAGHDTHLFIRQFGEDDEDIKLIPNTDEKYISFSKVLRCDSVDDDGLPMKKTTELRFID